MTIEPIKIDHAAILARAIIRAIERAEPEDPQQLHREIYRICKEALDWQNQVIGRYQQLEMERAACHVHTEAD